MAKAKKEQSSNYTVVIGCDTADGTRYEPGDTYDAGKHDASVTDALLEMGCLTEGDSN